MLTLSRFNEFTLITIIFYVSLKIMNGNYTDIGTVVHWVTSPPCQYVFSPVSLSFLPPPERELNESFIYM